jgi:hypothetical protein
MVLLAGEKAGAARISGKEIRPPGRTEITEIREEEAGSEAEIEEAAEAGSGVIERPGVMTMGRIRELAGKAGMSRRMNRRLAGALPRAGSRGINHPNHSLVLQMVGAKKAALRLQ